MHEAMAQYQTLHRLKPVGRHRRMTDELFDSALATCRTCKGHGLRDAIDRRSWRLCDACRGLGSVFTKSAEEFEALRERVLAAYPEAAADPVPSIFGWPVAFSEATREVINLSELRAGGSRGVAPCKPVPDCVPRTSSGEPDVLAVVPATADILHLESVLRLTADSSPLEQLRLWHPSDEGEQHLRRFLLDFGHRVLAAERGRQDAR